MKAIGIMGGTFNPIHEGHIAIAKAAYEQYKLDEVIFIPSGNPPHKKDMSIASDKDRYNMVCDSVCQYPYFSVSSIEIDREGYSYTYETLKELSKKYSSDKLYFIVGADSLFYLEEWKHPELIMKYAVILVANRDDSNDEKLKEHIDFIKKTYGGEIGIINVNRIPISSTQIRENRFDDRYVPTAVIEYIREHHLYWGKNNMETVVTNGFNDNLEYIEKIKKKLVKKLDHARYIHTLGVAYTAASMAMCHDLDYNKAFLAGLLHDCAKCVPDDKKIVKCRKYDLPISEVELANPYLLHSKLGAVYAAKKYKVTDEDILNSITYHTTGRANMSDLEKIIFIADYIEPGRFKAARLDKIRTMAFINLDECTYMILSDTIDYLASKKNSASIDSTTLEAFEYYKKLCKKKK